MKLAILFILMLTSFPLASAVELNNQGASLILHHGAGGTHDIQDNKQIAFTTAQAAVSYDDTDNKVLGLGMFYIATVAVSTPVIIPLALFAGFLIQEIGIEYVWLNWTQ